MRNADFQDDWITLLPETKNHHWCYSSEFTNRRDFNPDGWTCQGSWRWLDDSAPPGRRRLLLEGPSSELMQRVNRVAVHDDRTRAGFPDAGGFPVLKPQRSPRPLRLVRDLTIRVRVRGQDVGPKAGGIELGLCPPGDVVTHDPFGAIVPPSARVTVPFPSGTYEGRWIQTTLRATDWHGPELPATAQIVMRLEGKGTLEIERAELTEDRPDLPNLLVNGGFESLSTDGTPAGWSPPTKYTYFPPALYYLFNTWHNSNSLNRGPVAIDPLVMAEGARSLKMIVATGDEKAVASDPVVLNQREPRLIEVSARVKTDRLAMLQIDALDQDGQRLDGFNFIHKAPVSIGTDDWRVIRQVFRPRTPVRTIRLFLCARGVNGYTLDDTGSQPQNNVVGTIWWDAVHLSEPESTLEELRERGVAVTTTPNSELGLRLEDLDLGERLLGANELRATIVNPGPARNVALRWEFTSPAGTKTVAEGPPHAVPAQGRAAVRLPYELTETCPTAYTEYRGVLSLSGDDGKARAETVLWFGTWTTPIDLELGALYLRPEQHQFVRMNLGVTADTLATLDKVQLELVRRGTGAVLKGWEIGDVPRFVAGLRRKVPVELRDDFANLLLARLDVSMLPVQPFDDPQRNWYLRARALDRNGREVARADSPPFCRQGHERAQPPIRSVAVQDGLLTINDRPWMPWGAVYGFVPVYPGPESNGPVAFRDLHNLPPWNLYDRFTSEPYSRRVNDLNCLRYVAGSITDRAVLEQHWKEDNLYCASAFVTPQPVFSTAELTKQAGGQSQRDANLAFARSAPMVVSVAPGIEEVFGLIQGASRQQLEGLGQVAATLRRRTGKPVMVGHGGYWNRFDFEKVPFFDVFDPETEPLFPADLHTDLQPLLAGKDKVIWLRPQMYEDVPYERWRFHVFVELMRGCRGWQIAHGTGDASLFRGLHGELEFFKPIVASTDPGPSVSIEPWVEHWSRRHDGKLYIIAATTRGIPFGGWQPLNEPGHTFRRTEDGGQAPARAHGVQSLPDSRAWPQGSKLEQVVRLDPAAPPKNLIVLVKAEGRWTHGAGWGDSASFAPREDRAVAFWFLKRFYRQAEGFLGWDDKLVPTALEYVPNRIVGAKLPATGSWTNLDLSLDALGVIGQRIEGVAFLHQGGRIDWGRTTLTDPEGRKSLLRGDSPAQLSQTRFQIAGLKSGTLIRVLFEDRNLTAVDGGFVDDLRGDDLYQRYGGEQEGYGPEPVALRLYEVPAE